MSFSSRIKYYVCVMFLLGLFQIPIAIEAFNAQTQQGGECASGGTCSISGLACTTDEQCEGSDTCECSGVTSCGDLFFCKAGNVSNGFCPAGSSIGDSCSGGGTCVGVCQSTYGNAYTSCLQMPFDNTNCVANDPCVPYSGGMLNATQVQTSSQYAAFTAESVKVANGRALKGCDECGSIVNQSLYTNFFSEAHLETVLKEGDNNSLCSNGLVVVPGSIQQTAGGITWQCSIPFDGTAGSMPDATTIGAYAGASTCSLATSYCGDGVLDPGCAGVCVGNANGGDECNVDDDCAAGNTCEFWTQSPTGFYCDLGAGGFDTSHTSCASCEFAGGTCRTEGNTCTNEECDDGNSVDGDGCSNTCTTDSCFVWTGGNTTEVCTGGAAPAEIFFVLDESGSMNSSSKLTSMKTAANNFIAQLAPGTLSGGVIDSGQFIGHVSFDSNAEIRATSTNNFTTVTNSINALTAGGGTNIGAGISAAHSELNNGYTTNNQIIVLLTDGMSSQSPAINAANAAKASGIEIYTIALNAPSSAISLLANIATDASYAFESPSASNLDLIFDMIVNDIVCQTVTNPPYLVNNCLDTCDNLHVDRSRNSTSGEYAINDIECIGYTNDDYNIKVEDVYGFDVYNGGAYSGVNIVASDYYYSYYNALSSIVPLTDIYKAVIGTPISLGDQTTDLQVYCYVGDNRASECSFPIGPSCGDGYQDPWEECDDGNTDEGDACTSLCTISGPVCQNGEVEIGEECDNGPDVGGDECAANCTFELDCNSPVTQTIQGALDTVDASHVEWKYIVGTEFDPVYGYAAYEAFDPVGTQIQNCDEGVEQLAEFIAGPHEILTHTLVQTSCVEYNDYIYVAVEGDIVISQSGCCGNGSHNPPAEQCDGTVGCDVVCQCQEGFTADGSGNCVPDGVCGTADTVEYYSSTGEDPLTYNNTLTYCADGSVPSLQETNGVYTWDCPLENGCTATKYYCGDTILQVADGEHCESGVNCGNETACRCDGGYSPDGSGNCIENVDPCGNGVVDSGETCDDGNANDSTQQAQCNTNEVCNACVCESLPCGNGVWEAGEECDFNDVNNCSTSCECESGYTADGNGNCVENLCGDGTHHPPLEECDGSPNCDDTTCTCLPGYGADGFGGCDVNVVCGTANNETYYTPGLTDPLSYNIGWTYCSDGSNPTLQENSGVYTRNCPDEPGCSATNIYCGNTAFESMYETCDGGTNCNNTICECQIGYVPDGTGGCTPTVCGDGEIQHPNLNNVYEECETTLNCTNCICDFGFTPNGNGGCIPENINNCVEITDTHIGMAGSNGYAVKVVSGDIDGDGDIDIIESDNRTTNSVSIHLNNGNGVFSFSYLSDTLGGAPSDVIIDDFDGDGFMDIYVVKYSAQNNLYLTSPANSTLGNITYTQSDIVGDAMETNHTAVSGDLDGDGDSDIYLGGGEDTSRNRVWINDGSGVFTNSDISGDTSGARHAAIADFDGDGDNDVYIIRFSGVDRLLRNNGAGSFAIQNIPGTSYINHRIAAGDIDGDGDIDVYKAGLAFNGHDSNALMLNNGNGSFTSTLIPGDTGKAYFPTFADVDEDGDLDVYVSHINGETNKLRINDGSGNFTAVYLSDDGESSYSHTIADVDSDAASEIIVGYAGSQTKIYNYTITSDCDICGNGTIEGDEQCDDNNTMSGDGCSSICEVETCTYASGSMGGIIEQIGFVGFRKKEIADIDTNGINDVIIGVATNTTSAGPFPSAFALLKTTGPFVINVLHVMDAGLSSLFEEVNNSWLTTTIQDISNLYGDGTRFVGVQGFYDAAAGNNGSIRALFTYEQRVCTTP